MDIDNKIRSRIEAVLTNDAKNYAEIRKMATADEPLELDPFEEERNLYQRVISSYRSAVSEVNNLLEENVGFFSGFCRIIDSIKGKDDFQEICSQIADCVLQDLGAEYCALIIFETEDKEPRTLHLEGMREDCKFFRVHSSPRLLGSADIAEAVIRIAAEADECLNIGDVYREPRFDRIDFPGVVRSLLCLPITLRERNIGCLILSHSRPRYFNDNHLRVLRILAGMVAHLRLLTADRNDDIAVPREAALTDTPEEHDLFSIILIVFETREGHASPSELDRETVRRIRSWLNAALKAQGLLVLYEERSLLALLPGVPAGSLPGIVRRLQNAFSAWKADQIVTPGGLFMNLGFATCDGDTEWTRTLEIVSLTMQRDRDESVSDPVAKT